MLRDLIYRNTWEIILTIRGHITMIDNGINEPSGRMLVVGCFRYLKNKIYALFYIQSE